MKENRLKQYSDTELIQEYQESLAEQYLDELYRRYHGKVRHFCLALVKNKETAEDLAQDTFIKVSTHLSLLKKPATFISWLFHIARNLCLDHIKRKSKIKAAQLEEVLDLADEIIDIEDLEAKEHKINLIQTIIDDLNQEDRTLLQLKYLEKATIKDIQTQFSLSESAVKMRLARARKKVLRIYDQQQGKLMDKP